MIEIISLKSENDYRVLLQIESQICNSKPELWHTHFGGIGVDRYLYGNGKNDIFEYGNLIFLEGKPIGYALTYYDDFFYNLWLLPQWEESAVEVIHIIESMFEKGHQICTKCNDETLRQQMQSIGYILNGESRFNAVINLQVYRETDIVWDTEEIRIFTDYDIDERVQYSSLPTGEQISRKMYLEYMQSEDATNVVDYVVIDKNTGKMVGYYSWWMDKASNTVMLNPVACIEQYRKRGISKRAILYGLNQMKSKGFSYAYVDTGYNNIASKALYKSVGFQQCKTYVDMLKSN